MRAARAAASELRARPRHVALLALVAGLLAGPPAPWLAAALALALAAGAVAGRSPAALLAAAALIGGAWLADARLAAIDRTSLGPAMGQRVAVRATLLERPRAGAFGVRRALARLEDGPGAGERVALRMRAGAGPATSPPGAELAVGGRLRPLGPRDGHDRRRGAHARLLVSAARATGRARGGAAGALDAVRARAEAALGAGLEAPEAALARGMVLGEDDALAPEVREDFRRSGLAHLVAASGQNVALLAAFALPALAAAGLGLRGRLAALLLLIGAYVPLAGAGPSIQRAGVMGAATVVAGLAGRAALRWYALLLAAAVTLLIDPRAAGDPGWQLSFAAVVAILALAPSISGAAAARGAPAVVADALALTTAATLGTAPLLAHHFGQVSLVSLPANLLAAPAVAPVMWLGMVAAALGQVAPWLAAVPSALAQLPIAYVEAVAHVAARAPGASAGVRLGSPWLVPAAWLAIAAVAAAAVAAPRSRRPLAVALLASVAAAVAVAAARPGAGPPPPGTLRISFLDVGQGDATLLQQDGAAVLVDAGPPDGPILERLRAAGVRRLDALVVTHAQADHEGGAAAVLARHPVGLLLDGGAGAGTSAHAAVVAAAARRGARRIAPDAGQVLRVGRIELRVLWPRRVPGGGVAPPGDANDRAIVLHVRVDDFDLLLPADAESNITAGLDLPAVEALKVAHHGSADPGLAGLLTRLRPRVAVIEVGRANGYGHPTAQALGALRAVPIVRRTDRDGTVRLDVRGVRMGLLARAG